MKTFSACPSAIVALAFAVAAPASQQAPNLDAPEPVDVEMVVKMRDEGFRRSQVMDLAGVMTDVYGPRYANSPSYDRAAAWARDKFDEWGLANVALEAWGEYGLGWENEYTSVHLLSPAYQPLIAYSVANTRGTDGVVRGSVALVDVTEIYTDADLEPYRGTLAGKIVLTQPERPLDLNFQPAAVRLSDEELGDMARLVIAPQSEGRGDREPARRPLSRERLASFFEAEGAAVLVSPGRASTAPMDKGIVVVTGAGRTPVGSTPPMAAVIVAAEHYNRAVRVLQRGIDVEMEVEVRNTFHDDDPLDYNVIAEIPGTDLADEIVMIGGHYDGEPAGTGATDNASGAASVMEAMRILKAVGAQPRRTIRAALWGSEESGLLGSRGYVRAHFGDRDSGEILPDHDKLAVYFNMDWYGRFRGIYLQGNDAARPIFEAWMRPFHDVGMSWIAPGNTGGSDHMAFQQVGLPGFQFIQDDLEFFTTGFHTNMDVYDRLVAEDLMQASVILASFAYHAAMRDEKFPRADGVNNGRRWHK
jgi:hypothetical protein